MHNQRADADAVTTCREPAPCATNEGARGWRRRFHSGAYATRDMFGLWGKTGGVYQWQNSWKVRHSNESAANLASIPKGHRAPKARPAIVHELPIMNCNGVCEKTVCGSWHSCQRLHRFSAL